MGVGGGVMAPVATGDVSATEAARRAGITYRQLEYWSRSGVFGETFQFTGWGGRVESRRRFTPADVVLVAAVGRVQAAAGRGGSGLSTAVLSEVADQVRCQLHAGTGVVEVRLGEHVTLTVDVTDLWEAAA